MSVRIFPYKTITGTVTLQLSGGGLDGGDWPRVPYIPNRQLVQLYDLDKNDWADAQFRVEVTLPAEQLASFEEEGDVSVLLSVECSRTLYRLVFPLQRHSTEANRWIGVLNVYRENFRGVADVHAVIVGTALSRDDRYVGWSPGWTLHFDEPEVRPITGAMKVRWMDFENPEPDLNFLKDYSEHEFFSDMQSEAPTLYLNKSQAFDGLHALLGDRRRGRDERPLHDAERTSIARSVWMGLINTAIASIRHEDGVPDWPSEDWKRLVLKRAIAKAYPLHGEDERLREVFESRDSTERSADLESRLQSVVDDLISAGRRLRNTLKYLKERELSN